MFKLAAVLSLLPLFALASPQDYGYGPPSSPSSGSAPAPTAVASTSGQINVQVGGTSFTFSPANITASVGTLITFTFPSGLEHSVTQSSFSAPCTPLQNGFDSGLQTSKQFTINVTDASTPIWFFCKAPAHCGSGMVGSINAPATGNTFTSFQNAALAIGAKEVTVPDNGPVTGGVGAIATAPPSAPGAASPSPSGSSPASSSAPAPSGSSGGSSSGAGRLAVSSGLGLGAVALVFGLMA